MIVTIYQPQYFPRLHYFNRILTSKVFVALDTAQFVKVMVHHDTNEKHKSHQADAPIKLSHGKQFLTVPIKKNGFKQINKTHISYQGSWQDKHLRTIYNAYCNSPYFKKYIPEITRIINKKYTSLADLNLTTIYWGLATILDVNSPITEVNIESINSLLKKSNVHLKNLILESTLSTQNLRNNSKPNEWLLAICNEVNANILMHGETSKAGYMDTEFLKKNDIETKVQKWKLSEYEQQFKRLGFMSNLSILDLVFNVQADKALDILVS